MSVLKSTVTAREAAIASITSTAVRPTACYNKKAATTFVGTSKIRPVSKRRM